MDAHDRERHVSIIRGVGGFRVDVFVIPGRCDVRPRCRQGSVFHSWTCVNVVVVVLDYFTRDCDDGECST